MRMSAMKSLKINDDDGYDYYDENYIRLSNKPYSTKHRVSNCESELTESKSSTLITRVSTPDSLQASQRSANSASFLNHRRINLDQVILNENFEEFKALYDENPKILYKRSGLESWLPIHYATSKPNLNIIEFILSKAEIGMINEQDGNGNTPLHIAIKKGFLECCRYLIEQRADLTIKNKDLETPLHYCIVCSKPDILELILKYGSNIDLNIGGNHNSTPLHYCAYNDELECAKLLMKHGAELCRPCNNGFRPVHIAAANCSNKVLEFLLNEGTKRGCTKLRQLSFVDIDNNKPLHAAVQVCNIEAVKLCLDNGASIDEVTENDRSTPVHVACAQGSLSMLKLMLEKQPKLKETVINAQDACWMTPLHKACMFDHLDVAEYLLKNGADIDAVDRESRTPLLLAITRNCMQLAIFLIKQGANVRVKDSKLRNILHITILNQKSNIQKSKDLAKELSMVVTSNEVKDCQVLNELHHSLEILSKEIVKRTSLLEMLNEQDKDGCTVIHYATKLGFVYDIRVLLNFGANISTLNHDKQSALHFAAKYGRYNSCLHILSSVNYKHYINEKDVLGNTPLHLAAQNGHGKVIKLLLEKGALMNKSYNGNTPFHEATINGHTSCMNTIHSVDVNTINAVNKNEDTALHLAAQNGQCGAIEYLLDNGAKFTTNKDGLTFIDLAIINKQDAVLLSIIAHERWQEALNLSSKPYKTPFLGIIQFSSEVSQAILDRCICREDVPGSNGKKYKITYNFKYLNWSDIDTRTSTFKFSPMLPLQQMVKYGRTECLTHKLCDVLLSRKWKLYGLPVYAFTLSLYLIFLAAITLIVGTYPSCIHDDTFDFYSQNDTDSDCFNVIKNSNNVHNILKNNRVYLILSIICLLYTIFSIFEEFFKIVIDGINYFKNFQVYVQFVLCISTIIFCVPFVYKFQFSYHYQWEAGSVAIFTAWFNLLLFTQIFYGLGIYVVMYTEILKTLIKAVSLFSIMIIAFSLVFYILLQNEEDSKRNSTPEISFLTTIIMTIGEIGAVNNYIKPYTDDSPYTLHFGGIVFVFVILFVILMPILLTNLLIGLAVGDIESVRKNAKLKREAMQIQLYIEMETKMPRKLFNKINEKEYVVTVDETTCSTKYFMALFHNDEISEINNHNENEDDNLIYLELIKQKQKVIKMRSAMNQQMNLIKLILQKMEIKTEDDDNDCGFTCDSTNNVEKARNLWSTSIKNARLRNFMLQQLISHEEAS